MTDICIKVVYKGGNSNILCVKGKRKQMTSENQVLMLKISC